MNEAGRLHEEFLTTALALAELGREDSNLQLPKSRGRRAQHRPKQGKNLRDASNAERAPPKAENRPRNRHATVIGIRTLA